MRSKGACPSSILAYVHMAIPYRNAKLSLKSANIFAMAIWPGTQPPTLIPANISGYTVC